MQTQKSRSRQFFRRCVTWRPHFRNLEAPRTTPIPKRPSPDDPRWVDVGSFKFDGGEVSGLGYCVYHD